MQLQPHFFCSALENSRSKKFSTSGPNGSNECTFVTGEVLDSSIDLRKCRPGDKIEIPYELTVSPGFESFWHSCFYSNERLHTSTPFARGLGFQGQVLPFALALFLASAMSHADQARTQLGWARARYHWPAFAGDTFRKTLRVAAVRPTQDGRSSVITFECLLTNQRDRLCFSCLKSMLFPFPVEATNYVAPFSPETYETPLREHIMSRAEQLVTLGNQSLLRLHQGQVILHRMVRPLTGTAAMQLASTARLTHARHFNLRRYQPHEIFVPGGCIYGLLSSNTSQEFHEVLLEELEWAAFLNPVHPGETVGALSMVRSVRDLPGPGRLQQMAVRTLAVKALDPAHDLIDKPLPLELFTATGLSPKKVEAICEEYCPLLSKKIVVQADRHIIRQAPETEHFLL